MKRLGFVTIQVVKARDAAEAGLFALKQVEALPQFSALMELQHENPEFELAVGETTALALIDIMRRRSTGLIFFDEMYGECLH